ncbi:uncharacterized protein BT62DRAFT_936545 [Guyanagaster necrorhizus]|uniref:Uroporphyrinogen-III synthase n=1 Tax=Guyanagaster necrorhizus TaxID=856835 RepID=A0A9P7VJM1_9AGAR|nr:uncharacterized protein BT62DRAFT_939242 [Guyanagaster necrorhizus MCA 3950]XP_043032654.1 uncharacterized protein BT62DRAFT_939259 [Guyanagaster necrorhizus MCA 3950]XP_043035409.1 uncharacterized protein BT62DRAFT_936545 [Guyanagaster necrorhizus MCA 3950]KAG7439138.1 hypothetical protein BT62DRAFT_939242 [Guyanagaster necrorhizus MCA 3950]KAG7439150.1 hypothetical protein BT62DRAFT_939259 [Guyanagaster necrorhizus MCA 3950]KAG7441909.1 hypothetical protein BT62DRAFT_936545 [Guyanagaster 
MTSRANILLLREPTPSSDTGQDRNGAIFTAANNTPFLIPVVETVFSNINELTSVTAQGNFDGVVMTSARSCEA